MGRYINWDDLVDRYSSMAKGTTAEGVSSAHIYYAEYELDSALSKYFTTPFSSNNITAKDLSIDLAYIRVGNFKIDEIEKFRDRVMNKINMLIDGSLSMMLEDGGSLLTVGESIVWSSTQNYHPVFDHGSILDMSVDHTQLDDEENDKL